MSRCVCVEHELEYITFCVKKWRIFGGLFRIPAGSRRAAKGALIF